MIDKLTEAFEERNHAFLYGYAISMIRGIAHHVPEGQRKNLDDLLKREDEHMAELEEYLARNR